MNKTGDELLLGVDLGTSSTKGVLVRPDGEVVGIAERYHEVSSPHPGWAEHDAEEVWWREFKAVCAELLKGAEGKVAGVCISGIGPCFLAADEKGTPLRPAILYGVDTRATKEIENLTEKYGFENILEQCGNTLTSQSVGPKVSWILNNEPEVWERTRRFFMAHTFVTYRLSGEYVMDHTSASSCDPLYDLREGFWIPDRANDLAPGLRLPDLRWPAEVAGKVTAKAAGETEIPEGTPVAVGTTDGYSEAVSVGVRKPGDVMIMYGTTMVAAEVLREAISSPNLWNSTGIVPGTYCISGGLSTSGALTAWFKEISGNVPYEDLLREAADVPPGSEALVVLPYFAGERAPISDPDARGVICGLTLGHHRGHLYRALLESTAYGIRHILGTINEAGGRGKRFVAVGGGTKGNLWSQIVSDVTGKTQEIPEQTIGASYGDAMLAGIAVGLLDPEPAWNPTVSVVEPNPDNREVYDELYRVYRDFYPATSDLAHALAGLQRRQNVVDRSSNTVRR